MSLELRQLRAFAAVVDEDGFTDAAIALGVSQASVSRAVASLERELGARLLRRSTRSSSLTVAGAGVLARARRVLAEVAELERFAEQGDRELRIGYAWAALGARTGEVQERWVERHPAQPLVFVNENSRSAGLVEGSADAAVLRGDVGDPRFDHALVGIERRVAALPARDPLARRRSLVLADLADRTIGVDGRTSTTSAALWREGPVPAFRTIRSVDDWLVNIAAGQIAGVSAQSTAELYPRPGVAYRALRDAPPVPVHLVWWRDAPPSRIAELVGIVTEAMSGDAPPAGRPG